jgi:hypothetical protein
VTLRLHGTRQEVAQATRQLGQVLDVVAVSQPYPDRGISVLVRVSLEVRRPPTPNGGPEDLDDPAANLEVGEVGG